MRNRAVLFVFGGLPGSGKTELAMDLAAMLRAVYLRADTLEQALRDSGLVLRGPEGYEGLQALAADNLALGLNVVADSVNPLPLTREAWRSVARSAGAGCCEIEVRCSDTAEHRRRVETRRPCVAGLELPDWDEVCRREYHPWDCDIALDTAGRSPERSRTELRERVTALHAETEQIPGARR